MLTVTFRGHPSFVFLYRETSRSRLTSRQEFEWSRDGDKNRARSVDEARQLGHVTDHSTDVWRPLFRESLSHASALHARVIEHFRGFSTIEASSVILKFNLILHVKKNNDTCIVRKRRQECFVIVAGGTEYHV